jgi:hypothetical protein
MEKTNKINHRLQLHTIVYDDIYEPPKLLPHFLEHYNRIGVTEFIIGVVEYINFDTNIVDIVKEYSDNYNVKILPIKKDIDRSEKGPIEKYLKNKHYVDKDEYIIYADLDEMFEYAAPMDEILTQMNKQNIWCIKSNFCDRISDDGSLKNIDLYTNLGEQFPIGTDLTKNIVKTVTQKVILQRGRVVLQNAGHHDTIVGKLDLWPIGNKNDYIVHHFKWNSTLLNRIKHRLVHKFSHKWYNQEQMRFLDFFEKNNYTIPTDHELLNSRYLGKLRYFN